MARHMESPHPLAQLEVIALRLERDLPDAETHWPAGVANVLADAESLTARLLDLIRTNRIIITPKWADTTTEENTAS